MKKIINTIVILLLISFAGYAQTPDFSMKGFATLNGGTTGGTGGTVYNVSNGTELLAAIGGEKNTTPRIILISGTIENIGDISIKRCANITIMGVGSDAKILQSPIIITSSSNIIIRNLTFSMVGKTGGKDIIEITTTSSDKSQNIWIDHCEFFNETPTAAGAESGSIKDRYDGLLDIKKLSEYITISWSYFHDHYKAILVGYTTNDTEDRKITMHHNRFERINSRVPSYRGGTGHIYNNYFEGWVEGTTSYGNSVHTREGCNLLVENNYFTKQNRTVYWDPADANEGYAYGTGNYFAGDVKNGFTSKPDATLFVPPYGSVYQDDVMNVESIVKQYAGVGIITSYGDYGNPSTNKLPSVTATSSQSTYDGPADVTINASATDEDGAITKVEFYNGNNLVGTETTAPFSYTFNGLMPGKYALTAKAYDNEGAFAASAVAVAVVAPTITPGESLFGATASTTGYFWFGESADNIAVIDGLYSNGTISGSASFKSTETAAETSHVGSIKIPSGGDVIFALPSCALFQIYATRAGDFGGNVYVSTDLNNWGESLVGISGKKGAIDFDFTQYTSSASQIYVRIVNTSSGAMNIFGANILLAGTGNVSNETIEADRDKNVIGVKYYDLRGVQVSAPRENAVYIKETIFDDGSKERVKLLMSISRQ